LVSLSHIVCKKLRRRAWLTAQAAMGMPAVDPRLGEKRLDLLAAVNA
jgi:hypothetical protein